MKINHTAITVKSLDESVEFYKNVFNMEVEETFARKDLSGEIVVLSDGTGGRLELFQFDISAEISETQNDLSAKGLKHVAFESNDVEGMWHKLKDKYKCSDVVKGKTSTYFFVQDPTNIPVEIINKYK
jgi:catechol 2,3-dioxygenase-like lactoylglutathione lyase family enzyme